MALREMKPQTLNDSKSELKLESQCRVLVIVLLVSDVGPQRCVFVFVFVLLCISNVRSPQNGLRKAVCNMCVKSISRRKSDSSEWLQPLPNVSCVRVYLL